MRNADLGLLIRATTGVLKTILTGNFAIAFLKIPSQNIIFNRVIQRAETILPCTPSKINTLHKIQRRTFH